MSDEQRVRTMCGWVGVEISRSRVRTPGKAGYGLYRVRGSERQGYPTPEYSDPMNQPMAYIPSEWTAYAFTLEAIELAVQEAIAAGTPAGPADLLLHPAGGGDPVGVMTRWTQAYRGRRDLGVLTDTAGCSHGAMETCPVGASLGEHRHDGAHCDRGGDPHLGPCSDPMGTPRQRQRAQNAEFQREHLERRAWGLKRRHAKKLKHNQRTPPGSP